MSDPPRLPRGRHTLSRADVARQQRTRIFAALAAEMAEHGYARTPVAAVLRRAGVSRETFYQQFGSKQDCFVAALEDTVATLGSALGAAADGAGGTPLERVDAVLAGYLDALAAHPDRARLFLIETWAAGGEVLRRRMELQQRFVDLVTGLVGRTSAADRQACEALVGAAVAMASTRIAAGRVAELASVRQPVMALGRAWLAQTGG